jgi:hypothetical protein
MAERDREAMDVLAGIRLRHNDPVRPRRHDGFEVRFPVAAVDRIDAYIRSGALALDRVSRTKAVLSVRAAGRLSGATESSRSRISASAPLARALASFLSLSPGTKSSERMSSLLDRYRRFARAAGDERLI